MIGSCDKLVQKAPFFWGSKKSNCKKHKEKTRMRTPPSCNNCISFLCNRTDFYHYRQYNVIFNSLKCDNFHFPITVLYLSSFEFSYPSTFQIMPSTTGQSKWQKFPKNLCTMQLSPTNATSASTPAQKFLI